MSKIISMKDINKSRSELRDKQIQTRGYVSRFEPLTLCLCFHRVKNFHYLHEETLRRYKLQSSTQEEAKSQCTKQITSTQAGGHKANTPLHKRGVQSQMHKANWRLQSLMTTKITNKESYNISLQ